MHQRKPRETRPVQPRCARPPSSSTPGPRSWSRRGGRRQNSPRRLGRGDRRLPTHDRTADAMGSGRPHWICEHHGACSPGTGKSHLAAGLGLALVENGFRVLYQRTANLVQKLQAARRDLALEAAIRKLHKYHLVILDDFSYVNCEQAETSVLFELIGARYENRSLLVIANEPFSAWGKIFSSDAMTVAAAGRPTRPGRLRPGSRLGSARRTGRSRVEAGAAGVCPAL